MRGREFIMKDAYSFSVNEEDLNEWYKLFTNAYVEIFRRCGLDTKIVASDTGQIGGDEADEFMVMSEVGEDTITYCRSCSYGSNQEHSGLQAGDVCPVCGGTIAEAKGIEVGNIFKLGTKYSESMNAKFQDQDGKLKPAIMGCYGIGISRTLMAAVEQHSDEDGIVWPEEIAPFKVHIIPVNTNDEEQLKMAEEIYNECKANGVEVLIDDRNERAGSKFKDADLIGIPHRIIVGKKASEGIVEYANRKEGIKQEIKANGFLQMI